MLSKPKADEGYKVTKFIDDGKSVDENGVLDIGKLAEAQNKVPVQTIKANAFKNNGTIKKLIVPNTVTKIEAGAFAGMTELEEIVLPFIGTSVNADAKMHGTEAAENKAVDKERSFGIIFTTSEYEQGKKETLNYKFGNDKDTESETYYIPYKLNKITVNPKAPEEGKEGYKIPIGAFSGLTGVSTVELGDEVYAIGEHAFDKAEVKEVVFGENSKLNEIMDCAFYCSKLEKITLPDGVTKIGEYAFASKTGDSSSGKVTADVKSELKEIVLSANLTEIGAYAFMLCESLTKVDYIKVTGTVTVGEYAFGYCKGIENLSGLQGKCSVALDHSAWKGTA